MKRLQGYRFRLEPKHKYLEHLNQALGANRFVWNKLLAMNLFRLENKMPILWYNDFLHQTSSAISKNHAMIVMEDLQVSNMSKSAKGTLDKQGKQVAQKSGLNRSILDQGWGEFGRQLEYKQAWLGGWLITVNPKYTSQTCAQCSHVAKENRTTQEHFRCVACGHENNADVNAAQNILKRGFDYLASIPENNRGTHGVSLSSEHHQMSAAGKSLRYEELATQTNLTQSVRAA